jgi:CRP-like cAMP-binding protein
MQSPSTFLKNVPVFRGFNDEHLGNLAKLVKVQSFAGEQIIFNQEDKGDALFIIQKGRIKVSLFSEAGKEIILSILREGDFFGEMALIDGEPRSANVTAIDPSELLILERTDFLEYLKRSPDLTLMLLVEMSRRLRIADDKIGSLALLDVYGRIARYLIKLAKAEGKITKEGIVIINRPTHQEIAGLVGTSRETVSRTLTDLQKRGVISVTKDELILKEDSFEAMEDKYLIYK